MTGPAPRSPRPTPADGAAVNELKVRARLLHKRLHGDDAAQARGAAARYLKLPRYAGVSAEQVLAERDRLRLKHALDAVAREAGHASWTELKRCHERRLKLRALRARSSDLFHPRRTWGFLKAWYSDHATARAHLEASGGYLLPYHEQMFVCGRDFVEALGLDPDDPDWARVGFDGVHPADPEAWARLEAKARSLPD